jgi:hypothetical protein
VLPDREGCVGFGDEPGARDQGRRAIDAPDIEHELAEILRDAAKVVRATRGGGA